MALEDSSLAGVVNLEGPTNLSTVWQAPYPDLPPAYVAYGDQDTLEPYQTQGVAAALGWFNATTDKNDAWLIIVDSTNRFSMPILLNMRMLELFIDLVAT